MSNPRDPSRLRQGLNPLLTTSLGGYHQSAAPLSAVSLSSTSHHLQSAQPTPTTGSAIQPYNPQEWIASPAAGPERTHQFPETQSVSPPPPPPYSPPWNQRPVSSVFESSPAANTSAARVPPSNVHRPSPEPVANTSFPPPPGANGRGANGFWFFTGTSWCTEGGVHKRHRDSNISQVSINIADKMGARHATSASTTRSTASFIQITERTKYQQDE
ncbi:hypothetical protein HYQ44_009597 [Verticillium longisporum]|nr:hypothetical protein HYQ44_009597 [Verticillium longisporum]